ncbi:hypothetical protein C8R45DRAFT_947072 [Mycena sanguinolenta]|nr:hypothetical protein C8R45DRAFT_947072 [Mycena sanguinolenta]
MYCVQGAPGGGGERWVARLQARGCAQQPGQPVHDAVPQRRVRCGAGVGSRRHAGSGGARDAAACGGEWQEGICGERGAASSGWAGARVHGSAGARERGCAGARVRGCAGARIQTNARGPEGGGEAGEQWARNAGGARCVGEKKCNFSPNPQKGSLSDPRVSLEELISKAPYSEHLTEFSAMSHPTLKKKVYLTQECRLKS